MGTHRMQWQSEISPTGRLARRAGGRPEQKVVRFAEDELAIVQARAQAYGLDVSAFLHFAGLHFVPPAAAPRRFRPTARSAARDRALAGELEPIRRLLYGLANNLNQLTRQAHQTGQVLPDQVAALADSTDRTLTRLRFALESLDPNKAIAWPRETDPAVEA